MAYAIAIALTMSVAKLTPMSLVVFPRISLFV
jgi:hypothetical protein